VPDLFSHLFLTPAEVRCSGRVNIASYRRQGEGSSHDDEAGEGNRMF
jgi:hypothetical protein